MKKWILFDFDGTLTHTTDVAYMVYQEMASRYRLTHLTKTELLAIKALPLLEKLRALGIHLVDLPKLMKETQKIVRQYLEHTEMMPGIEALIKDLKAHGYRLAIISSNTKKNILFVLKLFDLMLFDQVYGKAGLFNKDQRIKKVLKRYRLSPDEVLYIGDEVRDITACQSIHVDIASVTWGFDDLLSLQEKNPTYLIHHVDELRTILLGEHHE